MRNVPLRCGRPSSAWMTRGPTSRFLMDGRPSRPLPGWSCPWGRGKTEAGTNCWHGPPRMSKRRWNILLRQGTRLISPMRGLSVPFAPDRWARLGLMGNGGPAPHAPEGVADDFAPAGETPGVAL